MSSAQETAPALQSQQEGLRQEVAVERQVHEGANQDFGDVQIPELSKSEEVGRLMSISACEYLCCAAACHCSCYHEHSLVPCM